MNYTFEVFPPKEAGDKPFNKSEGTIVFKPENEELSTVSITIEMPYFSTQEELLDFIEVYVPKAKWQSELYGDEIGEAIQEIAGTEYEREIDL